MKPVRPIVHSESIKCSSDPAHEDMKRSIQKGLNAPQKYLPCKYFYDRRGSALFERICTLPEYYQTRTELSILETAAIRIMSDLRKGSVIELGSGSSRKIRILLDAARGPQSAIRYVAVDVCEPVLMKATDELSRRYPDLAVMGMVADFRHTFDWISDDGDKLITFFGSTIGNLTQSESSAFLKNIANEMGSRDRFIVGMDMVKQKEILESAYNDTLGVTARFNKNILNVINRELNASFYLPAFDHLAFYNEEHECIEMHLRANKNIAVPISALNMTVTMKKGETIFTETCRKFRKNTVEDMAAEAGLRITRWFTDYKEWFALVEFMRCKPNIAPALRQEHFVS